MIIATAMHLVFLNQYYPPDAAPTGVMLAAVAEELASQGHAVTVICAEGGYANVEHRTSKAGNVAAVCDRQGEDPRSTIRVIRIRATRFGRGTFIGKVADYFSYYVGVAWTLMWLRPQPERIVALTTPPYLSVLARIFSKLRGGDHAHWVMDLYPDVMVAHGMLRAGGGAHRLLAGLARWGFGGRRCAALLTLGPDMAERVAEVTGTPLRKRPTCRHRGAEVNEQSDMANSGSASRDKVGRSRLSDPTWIPLWSDAVDGLRTSNVERRTSKDEEENMAVANRRHARGWREDELVVMYSGNMGLGHRFGEILEVIGQRSAVGADDLGRRICLQGSAQTNEDEEDNDLTIPHSTFNIHHLPPARFVFFGGGKRRVEIEAFVAEHPEAAVELNDYAPSEELGIHLRSADVHLVSLAAEWTGTMVPSKLQGIFQAARPVIFIGDANSSIGRWVAESGGGWLVAPGDVEGLERAIDEACDPKVRESRGRAAKAFAEMYFDKRTNVRQVAGLLACALV